MADDINVVFGADTTQLDAAVSKVKSEMQSLTPGAPGSGILTPLPQAFGGAPSTLLERATAVAKANAAAAQEAGTAMKNFARAEDEAGEAAGRAGINFGAMAERLAARLVIFEAIRLAIQGIKYAFDQISNLQQAQLQFDAMSDSVDHLAGRFEYLKQQAAGGFLPIEKAVQVRNTLQDFGATTDQAAMYVKDLGQWSQILGVDADKLAQALGRVSQGEGSLQDMRLVTHMMGDQAAAGRELIQTYIDLQKAQKNLEIESATVEKSMAAVMRATKEMVGDAERQTDRQMSLFEKLAAGQENRARAAWSAMPTAMQTEHGLVRAPPGMRLKAGFGGQVIAVPEPESAPDISRALEFGGMIGGMRVPAEAQAQYKRGLEEIADLEGTNTAIVRAQVRDKILGTQDVMRAGREVIDDEMRNLERVDEARRAHAEFQKTEMAGRVAGAKAGIGIALPQAVTAPPAGLWEGFTNSIKGAELLNKTQFDAGIAQLVTELGKVQTASNGTTTAVGDLQLLFTSG